MTNSLLSSGEFSDLSEMSNTTDTITITHVSNMLKELHDKVKPITLQPCGHGICSTCCNTLKDYAMQVDEDGRPVETPVNARGAGRTLYMRGPTTISARSPP